jgi:hypothetical protein
MILNNKVQITVVPLNFKRLKKIYPNIKYYDIIEINVSELSENSPIIIDCQCEICGGLRKIQYRKYLKNKNRYSYYSCKKCKNRKTEKTKKLLYGDSNYNNPDKMILTKERLGIYIPLNQVTEFKKYRKIVNRVTYKSKKVLYQQWDGYDYYDHKYIKNNLKLNSNDMKYPTVDHKISIHEGFLKNISPNIIGGIDNLCITKRKINLLKRNKSINTTRF